MARILEGMRFFPLSAHYLRAGFDQAGKLIAVHHRKTSDEVTKFQFPEMYEKYKGQGYENVPVFWARGPRELRVELSPRPVPAGT